MEHRIHCIKKQKYRQRNQTLRHVGTCGFRHGHGREDHEATMFGTSKKYKGWLKVPNKYVANVIEEVVLTTRLKIEAETGEHSTHTLTAITRAEMKSTDDSHLSTEQNKNNT